MDIWGNLANAVFGDSINASNARLASERRTYRKSRREKGGLVKRRRRRRKSVYY